MSRWDRWISFWDALIFKQPHVRERLAAVRVSVGGILVLLMLFGPYGRFQVDAARLLYHPPGYHPLSIIPVLGQGFIWIKWLAILSGILFVLGRGSHAMGWVFLISSTVVGFYASSFTPEHWTQSSHLILFLGLLCVAPMGKRESEARQAFGSFLIFAMQFYGVYFYFLAGVIKLWRCGWDWLTTGLTPYVSVLINGTEFGRSFLGHPDLFKASTLLSGIFELGVILLLPFRRYHWMIVASAVVFHLACFASLYISFWFLWGLLPALFIYKNREPFEAKA